MGLFEKIKKAAPTVGTAAAAGSAAAAGVYAGSTFAKDKPSEDEAPDQKPEGAASPTNVDSSTSSSVNSVNPEVYAPSATVATPPTSVDQPVSPTQIDEFPESIYDSATGTTTYHYANGNTLIEYADGSRAFYDASTGETTGYDASTGTTITQEVDGDIRIGSSDGSRVTFEADGDVIAETPDGATVSSTYDPVTGNTIVQNYDGLGNTGIFNSDGEMISTTYIGESPADAAFVGATATADATTGSNTSSTEDGLFASIKEINDNIPNEMKAAGLGIPDQPVQEFRTYQEGSLEDGRVRYGYEGRVGWEASHSTHHSGRDEIAPGIGLNSEATYDAESFVGASSKGEAGAEWNSEEAHLYAQGRTMVGAEANVDAAYKGTLDVEGINHQPGAEVQGHANAFAGAEAEGRGDLNVSSDGARGSLGGEAFAGAKAELGWSGAASIDGNEFARGEGGVDARAGIGAEFDIDAGYQNDQIQYGVDMGAALGVGAGYQYSGSVDAPGIITHPDAVWESAVEEVSSYVPEIPSYSTDPSTYTAQAEQYVVQQVQEYVPIPEEVSQVAEVISDPGSVIEDIGSSFGF